jgi:hypothetical protein
MVLRWLFELLLIFVVARTVTIEGSLILAGIILAQDVDLRVVLIVCVVVVVRMC